ncbi:MAG: HlyD family efflux transporter periplasmic adaptor subunit [Pseudomonadota bacterium]
MASTAATEDDLEPKSNALLSAVASFGPLIVLTAVVALQLDDLFEPPPPVAERPTYYTSVAVTVVAGEAHERAVQLTGQAVPEREVALRVADNARVMRVPVRLGERVVSGQTICELRYSDSRSSVALTTPINGQVNALNGAPGSILQRGSSCASIIDNSSMVVRTQVRPHEAMTITPGDLADVAIAGERRSARVHYVHPKDTQAANALRTLELHTDDLKGVEAGDAAVIEVRTQQIAAAVVPQSALIMVPGKGLSVQMVAGDGPTGVVVTVPVEIIAAAPEGVYVRGLPKSARLIVKDGRKPTASEGDVVRIGRVT